MKKVTIEQVVNGYTATYIFGPVIEETMVFKDLKELIAFLEETWK